MVAPMVMAAADAADREGVLAAAELDGDELAAVCLFLEDLCGGEAAPPGLFAVAVARVALHRKHVGAAERVLCRAFGRSWRAAALRRVVTARQFEWRTWWLVDREHLRWGGGHPVPHAEVWTLSLDELYLAFGGLHELSAQALAHSLLRAVGPLVREAEGRFRLELVCRESKACPPPAWLDLFRRRLDHQAQREAWPQRPDVVWLPSAAGRKS